MRRVVQVCACAVALVVVAQASAASQRLVTLTVFGAGKGFWKLDGPAETARLSLAYRWNGTLRFSIAGSRLSAHSATTLVASWHGTYRDKKGSVVTTCSYRRANARARVTATLADGRAKNTLELTFRATHGFFPNGKVACTPRLAQTAPAHFAPSWLFRDNLQDHGRLTSDTAILVLPRVLLVRGRATIAFPSEVGRNAASTLGRIAWSNRGEASVRAR